MALAATSLAFYWSINDWTYHPFVKKLSLYCVNNSWRDVANDINNEFRRYAWCFIDLKILTVQNNIFAFDPHTFVWWVDDFIFKNRQVMYTNKPCHESCGDRQLDNNGWSMAMEPPFSTSKWCRVKDCQDRSASVIHRRPSWWFPIPIDTCKKSKSKSRVFYLQVSYA